MLGQVASARSTTDKNNFLLLRLVAASLVIYGHAPAMAAPCRACVDLISRLGYRYSGDLGLHVFFVISGFLVVASYDNRRDLFDFVKCRLLRLLPALWVCLILTVLIGSLFTAFDFSNYIKSSETISYALSNGFLYQADFSLPGVVLTSNAKYGAIVNGSIWTIPIEARLYLIVAMVGAAQLIGIKFGANLATILLIGVGLISPSHLPFIGEYNQNWRIAAFFSAGALLYINRDHVPLDGTIFALLILAAIISHGTPDFEVFAGAAIAYGTLFLAYAPTLPLPSFIEDYSYGLYI
jgi:peptidoglycan/LPS O-acetylase OafA/YrhL